MYNQNIIDYMKEQDLRQHLTHLKANDIKLSYWSIKENEIKKRNAVEHYILKYFNKPHNSKEALAMKKYIAEIRKFFGVDPVHFSDSYLLADAIIPKIYMKTQAEMIHQFKLKHSKIAFDLFHKSLKQKLSDKEKNFLSNFLKSTLDTNHPQLKQAQKEYFSKILKENNLTNNEEMKFVLAYVCHDILKSQKIDYKFYFMDFNTNSLADKTKTDVIRDIIAVNQKKIKYTSETLPEYIFYICHECQYLIQHNQAFQSRNYSSLIFAREELFASFLNPKNYNGLDYLYSEIENAADQAGYQKAREIYYELGMENVVNYLKRKEMHEKAKSPIQYEHMINENGTMVAQEKFNVVHLNEIVKNKPEILLIYPVLNYLYNSDGSSKNFEELMTSYTNENLNTIYHDYLINYIADNKLKTLKIQKYSTNEQKNIFNNLIYLWKNEKIKIDAFINSKDAYLNVDGENKMKIQKFTSNYHSKLFISLTNYLSENYKLFKELFPYAFEYINNSLLKTVKGYKGYLKTPNINPAFRKLAYANIQALNNLYLCINKCDDETSANNNLINKHLNEKDRQL